CGDDSEAVRFVSWRWRRTFPPMASLGDCGTGLHPLAPFSSMVRGTMATVACPGLRSGLRLHFCGRPFICSVALHTLHLFSVLTFYQGNESDAQENRRSQLEDEHDPGRVSAVCGILPSGRWRH